MITQKNTSRRSFLKKCGLSTLPFLLPSVGLTGMPSIAKSSTEFDKDKAALNFMYDGLTFSPKTYLEKLNYSL